jgi:hypothetical protein
MRLTSLSAVLVALALAACSSQPVSQESSGPVAPAPEAQAKAPAPAETSAASTKPAGKIPSGYRLEKRNGKDLYCRNETLLGSRFSQKTCFTREQLEEIQRRTESAVGGMEQTMKVCSGDTCTNR